MYAINIPVQSTFEAKDMNAQPPHSAMAVGGTPVGPVLAGPILARTSYMKAFILVKFILLRRKILSKRLSICNYILYYLAW